MLKRLAIALLVLVPGAARAQCPNLSGRYALSGEDGFVIITIRQARCASILIDWAITTYAAKQRAAHTLVIDGRFQPDTAWFGATGYQLTAARFNRSVLELLGRSVAEVDSGIPIWTGRFARLPDGDLCVGFQRSDTADWGNVAERIEGTDKDAEPNAVRRAALRALEKCARTVGTGDL